MLWPTMLLLLLNLLFYTASFTSCSSLPCLREETVEVA